MLLLALIRIQIQLVQAHASPGAAPARYVKADVNGHATWVATLEHQQFALRLRCLAAAKQRDNEVRAAEALCKRAERRRQLADVLRRCAPVYEVGPIRLHAPIEAEQAAFERVVLSPHAREARLVRRWVAREKTTGEKAAAPSAAAVVDFVAYVGRLIAAEYGFGTEQLAAGHGRCRALVVFMAPDL